jgi:hypothetical protein
VAEVQSHVTADPNPLAGVGTLLEALRSNPDMYILLFSGGPSPTREEMIRSFMGEQSFAAVLSHASSVYWVSFLFLAFCAAAFFRTKSIAWLSPPILALAFQNSLRMLDRFDVIDEFGPVEWQPHLHLLLHEIWSGALAFLLFAMASLGLVVSREVRAVSRRELAMLFVSFIVFATIMMDWIFIAFVYSPVGGSP